MFIYIGADDVIAATRFIRKMTHKIAWIAESGFPGVSRDDLVPGLKALTFLKRCIYFRTTPDQVIILRVLHGHQQVSSDQFPEQEQQD